MVGKKDVLGLRYVWNALSGFVKEDFHWGSYLAIGAFITASTAFNYWVDLEDTIIDGHYGKPYYGLLYACLYTVAWFGSVGILRLTEPSRIRPLPARFYWLGIFGLVILSAEAGFYYHMGLENDISGVNVWVVRKMASQLTSVLTIFLPLLILYPWIRDRISGFYGIKAKGANVRPYVFMLALMSVPVYLASLTEGFRETYPTFQGYLDPAQHPGLVWLYELCYGWDFITVELLFRGFFVIALAHAGGRSVVLPMVTLYCFLHFGKPVGECIGSIFGGYILGALALRTGNTWGGIFVHLGIAWLMELAAWWQF